MTLNVDGSHGVGNQSSACGRLLKDDARAFIQGFFCKISSSNVLWVELWSLLSGLKLARDLGIKPLIIEVDSITRIDMVHQGHARNSAPQVLLDEVKSLLRRRD